MPLPQPRPVEVPHAAPAAGAAPIAPEPEAAAEPKPPEPSACRIALTETIAIAPTVPPIRGPGDCGGEDLVRLEAVVLPNAQRVSVKPAAILRCKMATAIASWVRDDVAPLVAGLGSEMTELDNFDSFECRGRNRVKGAKLSEHGKANALDVRGFRLANGTMLSLTDRTVARDTREKVLLSVCSRFATVLGPASDWYHEDHIHLDLAERRNNYKLCQWGVFDPWPTVAPLMPAGRPEDAPPRQTEEEKAAADKTAVSAPQEPATEEGNQGTPPQAKPTPSRSGNARRAKPRQ